MQLFKKLRFYTDSISYSHNSIKFQVFMTAFFIFCMHIIIYNSFDIMNNYRATKSLRRGLYYVEVGNEAALREQLESIGHIIDNTNVYIPTNEKCRFSSTSNYVIYTYSAEMMEEFPMTMSKEYKEDREEADVYQAVVSSKTTMQYHLGHKYDIELNDGEIIKIRVVGILKWHYWINDCGFGNIESDIYVYDPNYVLSQKYKEASNKGKYVSCELSERDSVEKILSDNSLAVEYDSMLYDDFVWASDVEEAIQENIFGIVLFILCLLNIILMHIRLIQENRAVISVFLQNGCSLFEFVKIYLAWFLKIYLLPYIFVVIISGCFVYESLNTVLRIEIEIKLLLAYLASITGCLCYVVHRIRRLEKGKI